jgi:hypothetical protein
MKQPDLGDTGRQGRNITQVFAVALTDANVRNASRLIHVVCTSASI